eukprot:jgi/Chrzof1/1629/Cz10g15010.t1
MSLALRLTRPATRFWRFYCDQLERRPLLTKCCTGVVGTIASDGMAQLTAAAVKKKTSSDAVPYDWGRTARLVTWSFCVGTPMGATWFKFLDDRIIPHNPKSPKAIFTKIAVDQAIMAPLGTALFFCGIKTLEGHPEQISDMFRDKYIPFLKSNYALWPIIHLVNFAFVPSSQRILYINAVSILWGAFASHLVMTKEGFGKGLGGKSNPEEHGIAGTTTVDAVQDVTQHRHSGLTAQTHAAPSADGLHNRLLFAGRRLLNKSSLEGSE